LVAVGVAFLCTANSQAGTQAGKSELRIDGSLQNMSMDSSDSTMLSGQIVYNKFLSDQFSLGAAIRPMIQTQSSDYGDDQTTSFLFLLGRGDFYLTGGESSFVPYIGAHAGVINYEYDMGGDDSTSESVLTYGIQGGGKFFVNENTSFNIELDLSIYSPETEDDYGDSEDVTVTTVLFGYSVYF